MGSWPFALGVIAVLALGFYFFQKSRPPGPSALDLISEDREFREKKIPPESESQNPKPQKGFKKSLLDFFKSEPRSPSPSVSARSLTPPMSLMPYPRYVLPKRNPAPLRGVHSAPSSGEKNEDSEAPSEELTLYGAKVLSPSPGPKSPPDSQKRAEPSPSPSPGPEGPYQARISVLSEFSYGGCRESLGGGSGCPIRIGDQPIPADVILRNPEKDSIPLGILPLIEGELTLHGLSDGKYFVELRIPGFISRSTPLLEVQGDDLRDIKALMTPGDVETDGRLDDRDELKLRSLIRNKEYLLNGDLNGDGKIDPQDLEIWEQVKRKYRIR